MKEEYQAVRLFERDMHGVAAQFHLQIASADAAFEQAKDERCWMEYSELLWANKHVAMTKEDVRATLERLRAIAPSLNRSPSREAASTKNAAEFRYLVRHLIQFSRPQCPLTTAAENTLVMGPAQREIVHFRESLQDSPFADHFDIAQADTAYELSITMPECADPSQTEPTRLSQSAIADVTSQIASIGRLIRSH